MGVLDGKFPVKKLAKKFNIDDPQYLMDAIEALSYLILHLAKIDASEEEFISLYDMCHMNPVFKKKMIDLIKPYIPDLRDLLAKDNSKLNVHF